MLVHERYWSANPSQPGYRYCTNSHGVGSLVFASDGTMLVSAGDAASLQYHGRGAILQETYYAQALTDGIIRANENVGAFKSQMVNSHNGTILRIDHATGNGISSNPFSTASTPRSAKSRVWCNGGSEIHFVLWAPNTGSTNPPPAILARSSWRRRAGILMRNWISFERQHPTVAGQYLKG